MNLCGIITEYNPMHNGHLYHIQKAKELSGCDALITCMSGFFTQRGEPSIIDKFQKTKAALENGIDLVLELPYIYTLQNATIFAQNAVKILELAGASSICFGSETNNLEELKEIAALNINPDHLKEITKAGYSYPKAYGLLSGEFMPNDILAICYLKAMQDKAITPLSIKRTSDFNSEDMSPNTSAKAIRKAVYNNEDYKMATPLKIDNPLFIEDYFRIFSSVVFSTPSKDLSKYFLVDEGIEKLFYKNLIKYHDFESFMSHSVSKRYTKARIKRTMIHIINHILKEDVNKLEPLDFIYVLGFNDKGRQILKDLKEKGVKVITQFKNLPSSYRNIEYKAALNYANQFDQERFEYLMKEELKGPIIL